ncbi:MAG: hypothetical protein RBG13Loki_3015 [Promethearchaeota archaeon CR_4]|nr:MAG: hypothetical protein RBG13Loki_3015 [Candidatus Lokiarchaeota archaeon CR_4]
MGTFIATKPEEVSKSWLDYWSFGHLLFGAVAYFQIYAIVYYVFAAEFPDWFGYITSINAQQQARLWGLVGATIVGIIWEPIENIGFVKLGWKSPVDSWPNLIIDCIMVFIGALILYYIHIPLVNLTICIGLVILLIVTGYLTKHNTSS